MSISVLMCPPNYLRGPESALSLVQLAAPLTFQGPYVRLLSGVIFFHGISTVKCVLEAIYIPISILMAQRWSLKTGITALHFRYNNFQLV